MSFKWLIDWFLVDMNSMNVKDMQGTARGYMHADSHARMHCGHSSALYLQAHFMFRVHV